MNTRVIQILSSFLTVVMCLGLFTSYPVSAANADFTDLEARHNWAAKDIAKMSLRGIVEGDGKGHFYPDWPIRQEAAIAMVIRSMGLKAEADAYEIQNYDLEYKAVSDWAKPYIAVADQYGILRWDEQSRFAGSSAASREWIAQLLVRMINRESELNQSASSVNFADASKISSWAKDYVELAASNTYELIKGTPNQDGTLNFNPQEPIKRIELAALLSRADKFSTTVFSNELQGEVLSFTGNELLIQTNSGQQTITVDSKTKFFKESKEVSSTDIQRYQPVLIIGKPTASYVEILDEASVQQKVTGTVVKVYKELKTIALKNSQNEYKTYELRDYVSFQSLDGTLQSVDDLAENDSIELSIMGGKISSIYRLVGTSQAVTSGVIYDVDLQKQLITLQRDSGTPQIYSLSALTTVTYPDKRSTGLSGLRKGMTVEIDVEDQVVKSIDVITIVEEGTVQQLSPDSSIVTLETEEGVLKAYRFASNAKVDIQGSTSAKLTDIKVGDEVIAEVKDNAISSIRVTNRTAASNPSDAYFDDYIEGTILGVDRNELTIFLKLKSGEVKSYSFDDSYELYVNGISNPDLDDLKQDMNAKLHLFDDEVIYLEVDNRILGTVLRVDTDIKLITLQLSDNEQKSYLVQSDYDVDMKGDSGADLSDIERNDYVRIRLDDNNRVTDIEVQRDFEYRVVSVTKSSEKLRVEDEDEDEFNLYLDASVKLTVPGVTKPKIDDINEDDMVKVTYLGDDLDTVEVLPAVKGVITSVNSSRSEVTIKKFDGTSTTLTYGSQDEIKKGSKKYSSLSNLAVNDRVEVRFNVGNKKTYSVMEKVNGAFYFVDDDEDLYLMEGIKKYELSSNVYVHDGSQNLSLGNLERNDSITIYILNDEVYEINRN